MRTQAYVGYGVATRERRWLRPCTHGPQVHAAEAGQALSSPAGSAKAMITGGGVVVLFADYADR